MFSEVNRDYIEKLSKIELLEKEIADLKQILFDEGLLVDPDAPSIDHVYRSDPYIAAMKEILLNDLEKAVDALNQTGSYPTSPPPPKSHVRAS
jgi:hypothetical protein